MYIRLKRIKTTLPSVVLLLTVLAFSSCGKNDLNSGSVHSKNGIEAAHPDSTDPSQPIIECYPDSCGEGRYCLLSMVEEKVVEARCMAMPAECAGCECAKEEGSKHLNPELNCRSYQTFCSHLEGNITVSCVK